MVAMIVDDARYRRARAARPTYPEVGATRTGDCPPGYDRLTGRAVVGHGPAGYAAAREGLFGWALQRAAGITVFPERVVEDGTALLRVGVGPLGITAPCRVVWTVDEPARSGYAYGTLPGHPECGEEAFVLDLAADGTVTLTISGFSRPAAWWARLGSPVTRRVQQRILRAYLCALQPTANT